MKVSLYIKKNIVTITSVMENQQQQQHISRGLLKASDIARILTVTPRTVLNWCERGLIPVALRAGRTVRFDICAVREALGAATTDEQQQKLEGRQAAMAGRAQLAGTPNPIG